MRNLFVPYHIALKLKEKGFDEPCFGWWFSDGSSKEPHYEYLLGQDIYKILAPLYQQVTDWFRINYNYHISITFKDVIGNRIKGINSVYYDIEIYLLSGGDVWKECKIESYSDNYYESLDRAIQETLKLI